MAEHSKRPSATKRGPGRYHSNGAKKASPIKPKGAGIGFVQHTNPAKRARREHIALIGRRQFIKFAKAEARTFRDIVAEAA